MFRWPAGAAGGGVDLRSVGVAGFLGVFFGGEKGLLWGNRELVSMDNARVIMEINTVVILSPFRDYAIVCLIIANEKWNNFRI